jgi:hypothetical protein
MYLTDSLLNFTGLGVSVICFQHVSLFSTDGDNDFMTTRYCIPFCEVVLEMLDCSGNFLLP